MKVGKDITNISFPVPVYQTIVYVIHDLCLHPEYIEPLRRELEASYDEFQRTGQGLPLLDSFIKESARLTPVESSEFCLKPSSTRLVAGADLSITSECQAVCPTAIYAFRWHTAWRRRMGVCTIGCHQHQCRVLSVA